MVGELPKANEVHLTLILRISVENPHCTAISWRKKFAKVLYVNSYEENKATLTELFFCVIFFLDDLRSTKL